MINGIDLFGRDAITSVDKQVLKAANKTAATLFRDRFSPRLANNWDKDVKELTLEDVEKDVIESILNADSKGGKGIWKSL